MYYLRARYYDPGVGRFITRDPWPGDIERPYSLNLYLYVENNPVTFIDPTGRIAWVPILLAAWAVYEIGSSVLDAYATATTLMDPCASNEEKILTSGLFVLGLAGPGGGYSTGFKIGSRIEKQLAKRGWTLSEINDTINNPARVVQTRDLRNLETGGRMSDPATAYIRPDGSYIIRNDTTGDIVQISNRNKPDWKAPWDDPNWKAPQD